MNTNQTKADEAFQVLMSKKADLTFEQIAVLREECKAARQLKAKIEMEDAHIELLKGGPVVFETLDGLRCVEHDRQFLPGHLLPQIERSIASDDDVAPVAGFRENAFRRRAVRVYAFKKFIGGPGRRAALYSEMRGDHA